MKIIGKTEDGFILDATHDEVALLMGFRHKYEDDFKKIAIGIGTEMQLGRMAATSEFLRTIDKDRLKEFKDRVSYIIDDVDRAIETVTELTLFEKIKE